MSSLREAEFTPALLARDLVVAATDGFAEVGTEQKRAIACALWRHAVRKGLQSVVPNCPHQTKLQALAEAVHDLTTSCPLRRPDEPPFFIFTVGAPQRAVIVSALFADQERLDAWTKIEVPA